MITSDSIRGYNDVIILAILAQKDSYGYEIAKEIRARTQELYVIKETTLYSAFTRLERQKLIQSYPGKETHGKKRTYYTITAKGKSLLTTKKQEWREAKIIVNEFLEGGENHEND
ncbi:MAG TPA: PadR family transcriptional regulator [Tetragenococcus sp.]|nr:PadR family transcriptional regulator [Tetragenococcus sp.]